MKTATPGQTLVAALPCPSRSVPEKERRGGRVDLNAARREQVLTAVSGRLMRLGRRASKAGGSVREGQHPVTDLASAWP